MPIIKADEYLALLRNLDVGSPIAENDSVLYEARVELSVFGRLLRDEIDIIRGTKGCGKSALYRLYAMFFTDWLLSDYNIAVLKGVEVSGDPIFAKFKTEFSRLDEIDFQNFWRIYFLSLVNAHLIDSAAFTEKLKPAKAEIREYKRLAREYNFPVAESLLTADGLVQWVFAKMPKVKISGKIEPTGAIGASVEPAPRDDIETDRTPVFVAPLHNALVNILNKANLRLWIMLDRLDEVFPRRSSVESTALRALLRTTSSFTDRTVRLKLFIRDDIFDSITDVPGGFPALTHVLSRCSETLKWNKDQILHLIIQRIFAADELARHFRVNRERLKRDQLYRQDLFYEVFPARMRGGKNQSLTIDWLYTHCEDANGVVTPRDIIDLLILARGHQLDLFHSQPSEMAVLFSPNAIIYGHQQMSLRKKENYLKAEFDHFWPDIAKFENSKADHHDESLAEMLGPNWRAIVKDLRSIGFLKHNVRAHTYSIPFLYRQCLQIRQGRATAKSRRSKRS
jgi:hypothetical protein